jgi:hypothetical protein
VRHLEERKGVAMTNPFRRGIHPMSCPKGNAEWAPRRTRASSAQWQTGGDCDQAPGVLGYTVGSDQPAKPYTPTSALSIVASSSPSGVTPARQSAMGPCPTR